MKNGRSVKKSLAALTVALVGTLGLAVPASASSSNVSGTVNCSGTTTYYSTVRYMAEPSRTELFLSNSAGGARSGYDMDLGIRIVVTGKNHITWFKGANRYGVLQQSYGYVKNTRFTMIARMDQASAGTCDNSWGGTLYY